jgi:hypothetical protein
MAADPARGWLFLADDVATEVQVLDADGGRALAPIPLASELIVRALDPDGAPVSGAAVELRWMVRGQAVPVRADQTGEDGSVAFDGLVSGSTFQVRVAAGGYARSSREQAQVTIDPNRATTVEVQLTRPADGVAAAAEGAPAQLLPGSERAPATGLVVSDLALDPVSGRLYVTGSDLQNGHLLVVDPDERLIVHDWPVPIGVGDVVPRGDGRSVYLVNRPFSTVARVNVETGEEEASATVPSWPEAIAVDGEGNPFVACLRAGWVGRLDPSSLAVLAERELAAGLNRLAVVPDGSALLVSNLWTGTVTGLDPQSLQVMFLLPVAGSPRALALDPLTGTLIVGSADGGTVAFYSTVTYGLRQQLVLETPINDIAVVPLSE